MLVVSLLQFDAATRMANLSAAYGCGDGAFYSGIAAKINASIDTLQDPNGPLFLACDGVDALPDVYGSSYAAKLGVSSFQRRQQISDFLAAQWAIPDPYQNASVWTQGQLRYLPQPLYWQQCITGGCPPRGTYQNGAFWATPLSWAVPALADYGHADVAAQVVNQTINSFRASGINEAINPSIGYVGVRDYVASGTNTLAAANALLH